MKNFITIVLLLSSSFVLAQKEIKGNSSYEKLAYIDAIDIYEGVASKGYKSKDLFEKLGNAYYFNGMLDKSKKWYDQLFELNQEVDPEYYFRYAQSLKAVKDYDKADKMMEKFFELTNDYRGEMYIKNKMYLKDINDNLDRYKIEDAGVNSAESDYGTYFLGSKMYFVSSREFSKAKKSIDKWTNQNYTNLMSAELDSKAKVVYIDELTDELNTKFHESSAVFTKDGKTMYFTRNNYNKGKTGFNNEKVVLLKIYKATLENKKWENITELPFNSNEYNVAHPTLSEDEKTLYFASDMPGGFGSSDLYKVAINEDGSFGKPVNLGPKINTKSRETFPYINKEGDLLFASDGHLGLGGLDIFKSKKDTYNLYTTFENIGAPINSEKDDFAYSDSPFERVSFFTSNRDGGKGFDDIYKAIEQEKPEEVIIEDIVVDAITNEPVEKAKVSVYDANYNLIKETTTDANGEFKLDELRKDREYIVKIESNDYFTSEKRYKGNELKTKARMPISPKVLKVEPGDDLMKLLGINIYFDLDQYFIRPDAEVELAKLIEVMLKYPQLKVHIKSHTDSRQSESYNMRLSNFRAKSTRDYMIKKGVSKDRLTAKGYGESELLNNCSDGVPCTREEHQLNRRSEFIILK